MERKISIEQLKLIFGKNFIGPEELSKISNDLNINITSDFYKIKPDFSFDENNLKSLSEDYLLLFGISFNKNNERLTINRLRDYYGIKPEVSEPCFYNQDWYLKEKFAYDKVIEPKYYFLKKSVYNEFRAVNPEDAKVKKIKLPSAILCTFGFFAYYFHSGGEFLWEHDFVWCDDFDSNNDRIYIGRYKDPLGINKNGFNIHRHLSLKNNYSFIDTIE